MAVTGLGADPRHPRLRVADLLDVDGDVGAQRLRHLEAAGRRAQDDGAVRARLLGRDQGTHADGARALDDDDVSGAQVDPVASMNADRQRLQKERGLGVKRLQLDERLAWVIDQDVLRPAAVQPRIVWKWIESGAGSVQAQRGLVKPHTEVADATGNAGHDVDPVTGRDRLSDAVDPPGVAADLCDDAERFVAENQGVDDARQVALPHMRVGRAHAAQLLTDQDLALGEARDFRFDDFERPVRGREQCLPCLHGAAWGMSQNASACRMPSRKVAFAIRGSTGTSSTISAYRRASVVNAGSW